MKFREPIQKFEQQLNKSTLSWSNFDSNIFFSGSLDSKIYMWDRRTERHIRDFNVAQRKVNHIASDPFNANQFAAAYGDGRVDIWDIKNNSQPIYSYTSNIGEATYLDWHP